METDLFCRKRKQTLWLNLQTHPTTIMKSYFFKVFWKTYYLFKINKRLTLGIKRSVISFENNPLESQTFKEMILLRQKLSTRWNVFWGWGEWRKLYKFFLINSFRISLISLDQYLLFDHQYNQNISSCRFFISNWDFSFKIVI